MSQHNPAEAVPSRVSAGGGAAGDPATSGAAVDLDTSTGGYHSILIERYIMVHGVSREQHDGLAAALDLPTTWFGRWKGGPGELRSLSLDAGKHSCGSQARLDLAIAYLRGHRLVYEETRTVRHEPHPHPGHHDRPAERPDDDG